MLKLKLYIEYERKGGNTALMIKAQEELQQIETGRNINLDKDPTNRYQAPTWIDEINDLLWKQLSKLKWPSQALFFNKNKSIMEYTIICKERMTKSVDELKLINFV